MAISRPREIKLDPLMTDQFFQSVSEKDLEVKVSFKLPDTPDQVPLFLDDQSKEGKEYKDGFKKIMADLASWAKAQNIDASACERFLERYLDYSGSDAEVNKLYFHIYREGISMLAGIVTLLNNEAIPLDARVGEVANLFKGLMECGPGTFTNITSCYLSLLAFTDAPCFWMKQRRSIAEYVVLDILKQSSDIKISVGWEIHYANAVLNRFGDEIGIHMVEDAHAANCDPKILDKLFDRFKYAIREKLGLVNVLGEVLQSLPTSTLASDIEQGREIYVNAIRKLEAALANTGVESHRPPFYSEQKIVFSYEERGDYQATLSWDAMDILFLSIYSRFAQPGYVDLTREKTHLLKNGDEIHYIPGTSLQFAYVKTKQGFMPFASYCIELLVKNDLPSIQELNNALFATDGLKTIPNIYEDIIIKVMQYKKSKEYLDACKEDPLLSSRLDDFTKKLDRDYVVSTRAIQFAYFITKLPQDRWQEIIELLGIGKEAIFAKDNFMPALKNLIPPDLVMPVLEFLGKDILFNITSDKDRFNLIKIVPTNQWQRLTEFIGKEELAKGVTPGIVGQFNTLKPHQRLPYIELLIELVGKDKFLDLLINEQQIMQVIDMLPGNQRIPFIELVGYQKIASLISSEGAINYLLTEFERCKASPYDFIAAIAQDNKDKFSPFLADGQSLYHLLVPLPADKMRDCILAIGKDEIIQAMDKIGDEKYCVTVGMSGGQVVALVNTLYGDRDVVDTFAPFIREILKDTQFSPLRTFTDILYSLPYNDAVRLLDSFDTGYELGAHLGGERVVWVLDMKAELRTRDLCVQIKDEVKRLESKHSPEQDKITALNELTSRLNDTDNDGVEIATILSEWHADFAAVFQDHAAHQGYSPGLFHQEDFVKKLLHDWGVPMVEADASATVLPRAPGERHE